MSILFKKGLNKEIVKKISLIKNEPNWMLKKRIDAFNHVINMPLPKWANIINDINLNDFIYFSSVENKKKIPKKIIDTFKKIGVPTKEIDELDGIKNQYNSQTVFNSLSKELKRKKVIFCSMEEAIEKHSEIVQKYFGKLVPFSDNKYAALNTAVWSGGTFIYVPKNTKISKPLQAYFRINQKSLGQFERTLIIVEENSNISYLEGCTAPNYDENNLHAAVVEIFLKKNAKLKYSTIQNWSDNVLNLVTKRSILEENAYIEWIDGNIGSGTNMKYPCSILKGDNSVAKCISIAVAKKNQNQDTGAKMIHLGKNTKSEIISKGIVSESGINTYRGMVEIKKNAINSTSNVVCDSLLLNNESISNTYPLTICENNSSQIKHEAKITDFDKEKIFFLQTKGIDEKKCKQIMITGFISEFSNVLPLEYSVELNRLIKLYFE